MKRGDFVGRERPRESGERHGNCAVRWYVMELVRLGPRFADGADGAEAGAFFDLLSLRRAVWKRAAAFLVAKDLRLRVPAESVQSA